MRITVNGELRELEKEVSVTKLLELFSLPSQRAAIELNHEVVRRQDWESTTVREDDRVEIVHFVGGG